MSKFGKQINSNEVQNYFIKILEHLEQARIYFNKNKSTTLDNISYEKTWLVEGELLLNFEFGKTKDGICLRQQLLE